MSRSLVALFAAGTAALAVACGGSAESASATAPVSPPAVRLAPENVTTAVMSEISSGPLVSGQLTPAREAMVRAQIGGSIVALPVDRGQRVRAGAEVARISARDLQSSQDSAQAAVKSAETALAVATSEAKRTEALVTGGALAARDLEQAKNMVSAAEAQLAAARARLRAADQQLDDTSVKAPFAGIVSARPASIGDVVAPGTALLTIIDPSSLRLEASVPSDQIQQVRLGATVKFTIRGVPGEFEGRVERLSPAADPVTRQLSIFVTVPNSSGTLIAGLFAEGRVQSTTHRGVVVPFSAIDEAGPAPVVTRVTAGKAERVAVGLGARQADTEQVEVTSGLSTGDTVVLGSAKAITPGTPVAVVASRPQ